MKILLVVYDNEYHVNTFPQGTAYIAAALRDVDCDVEIYFQDVEHWPESHLTNHLNENQFDMIGIGVIGGYYQYRKLLKIAAAVNASSRRPPHFVLAGHGPSPEPDFFLKKTGADIVVIGEGEATIVDLVDALKNRRDLRTVKGIAFREGGTTTINPRRELIKNIDEISWPAYDLFPINFYRLIRSPNCAKTDFVMPVLSGRGCKFKCNFCYRMDKGFRPRSDEAIIEEIEFLKLNYGINHIKFIDELLMTSSERTFSLCEALLKKDLRIKWWCNGRLNFATPETLRIMKRAGCVFINYGIESFDDEALRRMNKSLTTAQIVKGVEATIAAGVSPGLNIIFGNLGETRETLFKGVEFLLKYGDNSQMRTIRPVTPYPGSELYYHAIERGLLKDCEDFYERKHLNSDLLAVNFTDMSDEEFYLNLMSANKILVDNYYSQQKTLLEDQMSELYIKGNADFRGFRQK